MTSDFTQTRGPVVVGQRRRGFTLLEIMVSIALVLILILGINQIFGLSSRTVSAGQTLAAVYRDGRAAGGTLSADFATAAVANGPCFWIKSEAYAGFRNRADFSQDADGNPVTVNPGGAIASADRIHRMDRMAFFAHGMFHRQTGNNGVFVDDMSSSEAYIWYGHLKVPGAGFTGSSDLSNMRTPLEQTSPYTEGFNPNGFYASQMILGRVVLLLKEKSPPPGNPNATPVAYNIFDNNGVKQDHVNSSDDPTKDPPNPGTKTMAPLSENSTATDGTYIQNCRYDLASTSMARYTKTIAAYIASNNTALWVDPLAGFRFQCNPRPIRPIDALGISQVVPIFLVGCTNFMVDFAGDYVTQDANGNIATPLTKGGDGNTDFVVDSSGVKKIRWYGFPRDTNGDGKIVAADGDVVPLWRSIGASALTKCERADTTPATNASPPVSNSGIVQYLVAWGPDSDSWFNTQIPTPRPTMIRVTYTLDDPSAADARIGAGQTFEYVFKVQ